MEHRIYLREWRKSKKLTQSQVMDRLAIFEDEALPRSAASLSRIENGKQPYARNVLEALAEIYECAPADLIGRNPLKEGKILDLVARMNDRQREQAAAVIEAILKTG